MIEDLLEKYIKDVYRTIKRGDAREESFYDILKDLIDNYGRNIKKKRTEITILPKKSEAGNPDFRVWDGESLITGYIEAKNPSERNLDYIETSEQLERYREGYPNLILTNFLEFRLYRNGECFKQIKIADYGMVNKIPEHPIIQNRNSFIEILNLFFDFTHPRITTPRLLAGILSKKAKLMRDYVILPSFDERESFFSSLYNSFKTYLIKDITKESFSDLFAQTFTYGLFISRYQYEIDGSGLVKEAFYNNKTKRIYINVKQYFTNVKQDVWNYFIGGYQVLYKWLYARKGKYLTGDDIINYIKIISALNQTIKIQKILIDYTQKLMKIY
ncbi:MAG: type ISP restriction/modification enzyme [bacterium]